MVFEEKKTLNFNASTFAFLISGTLVMLFTYLYFRSNNLDTLFRLNAPQGQSLYVISKLMALGVYVLMWWQIMLGLFKKLHTRHHIVLGICTLFLVVTHVISFISAVSLRQDNLAVGLLLPDFTSGYYKSGISLGVIALLCIVVAVISGALRDKLPKYWRFGHGLVYVTFALASVHGLMIGSEIGVNTYLIYAAVFSLCLALLVIKSNVLKSVRDDFDD